MRRKYRRGRPLYKRTPPRRRREALTDYRRRRKMIASKAPRVVVRKSNRYISVQLMAPYVGGDTTQGSALSKDLLNFGWRGGLKNTPAAYLTGLVAGLRASSKGVSYAIPDIGLNAPVAGSRIFAAVKGVIDSGIDVPGRENIYPDESRMKGQHMKAYTESNEKKTEEEQQEKGREEVLDSPTHFDEVKNRILSEVKAVD